MQLWFCQEIGLSVVNLSGFNRFPEKLEYITSIIEKMLKNIQNTIMHNRRMKQCILRKAFEGRLVPQNVNDEPVSLLINQYYSEKNRGC